MVEAQDEEDDGYRTNLGDQRLKVNVNCVDCKGSAKQLWEDKTT